MEGARNHARVDLYAFDTGDLAFVLEVEISPTAGYCPTFGMSMPLERATTFKDDAERCVEVLLGTSAGGEWPVDVTPYGIMETDGIVREATKRRPPLAVADLEDMIDMQPSPKVVRVKCMDERWEYYCADAQGKEEDDGRR